MAPTSIHSVFVFFWHHAYHNASIMVTVDGKA